MKRVLIVEDAIELGRLFKDTLKTVHPEFSTTIVPSAEEALLESSRYTIDLLVTDVRLPGMSGFDLIRKIRVRQPQVKVILMTGLAQDERMMRQKDEVKPDIFLRKPISTSVFIDSVEQLLGAGPAAAAEQLAALHEVSALLPGEPVPASAKTAPLHQSTGSLKLPAARAAELSAEGLSGVLSRLRGSLGGLCAMLLDERGRVVAQAGEFPGAAAESQIVPPVMAALSAGAKVSYLLGQAFSQSVQAYRGETFDLLAAPVGQFTLLMALHASPSSMRLALAFEDAIRAQVELAQVLDSMGLHVETSAETGAPETLLADISTAGQAQEGAVPPEIQATPLGQDPGLEKFEQLFTQKQTGQLHLQDPDTFWEQVPTGEQNEVTGSGVLSFDQAQKLGLLPEEKKE